MNLFEMYKGESSTNLMFDCESRDGEGDGKNDSRISDLAAVYDCFIHKGSEYRREKHDFGVLYHSLKHNFSISKENCQWVLLFSNYNYFKYLEGKGHPNRGTAVIKIELKMLIISQMRYKH